MQNNNKIQDQSGNSSKPLLAVVNDTISFEDYLKNQINEGYISEDGQPLKCECGCEDFKQVNQYYGEGWIEEFQLECKNEECLKIVGHWAFGHWQV